MPPTSRGLNAMANSNDYDLDPPAARVRAALPPNAKLRFVLDTDLLLPERPRKLRRVEYDQLVASGAFEDERIELLHGVLVEMSPIDAAHMNPIDRLMVILVQALASRARVRIQAPLIAADESEPQPDVAVVPQGDYRTEHPSRADLVIEVANTSLDKDRKVKAPLYAASGFREYWIVDTNRQVIEVYRDPEAGHYRSVSTHAESETLSPQAFPELLIRVGQVFE